MRAAQLALFGMVVLLALAQALAVQSFKVDSLFGVAEVRKAGASSWQGVSRGTLLYTNDMLRVHAKSVVRLINAQRDKVYVRENTQLRINLSESAPNGLSSQNLTAFFGTLYCIVQKQTANKFDSRREFKLYSPTAVAAIRGTSFSFSVDKNSGATAVEVFSGTVEVRSISKNITTFLGAPFRTRIADTSAMIIPEPILQSHLDTLRSWVPPREVQAELVSGLGESERNRRVITGLTENTVVVQPFTLDSAYHDEWNIPAGCATMFAEQLNGQNLPYKFVVAGDTAIAALDVGRHEMVPYVVSAHIERFDIQEFARVTTTADQYDEYNVARVRFLLRIFDIQKADTLLSLAFTGEVSGIYSDKTRWETIAALPFDLKDELFSASILGLALQQALENAGAVVTQRLREQEQH